MICSSWREVSSALNRWINTFVSLFVRVRKSGDSSAPRGKWPFTRKEVVWGSFFPCSLSRKQCWKNYPCLFLWPLPNKSSLSINHITIWPKLNKNPIRSSKTHYPFSSSKFPHRSFKHIPPPLPMTHTPRLNPSSSFILVLVPSLPPHSHSHHTTIPHSSFYTTLSSFTQTAYSLNSFLTRLPILLCQPWCYRVSQTFSKSYFYSHFRTHVAIRCLQDIFFFQTAYFMCFLSPEAVS